MTKKLLTVLLFLLPMISLAQIIISMNQATIVTMNVPVTIYVSDVKVTKPEKTYIGFLKSATTKCIVMRPSIQTEISSFLQRSFPKKVDLQPLIIKINDFEIQHEKMAGISDEVATIKLSLVFLYPTEKPNEYVKKYVYGTSHSLNTYSYVEGVYDAFKEAIKSFLLAKQRNELTEIPYSEADMAAQDDFLPEKFEMSKTKTIKKGIYRSFEQFRNNKPDTTAEVTIKEIKPKYFQTDTAYFAKVSFSPGANVEDIWGVATEKGVFIKIKNKYLLVRQSNQDFFIYAKEPISYELRQKYDQVSFWGTMGGFFGGGLGAGIAAGIAGGLILDDETLERVPYYLDYRNGDFFVQNQKAEEQAYKYARIILYHGVNSIAEKPLKMQVENIEFTLDKGEYTTFRLYLDHITVPIKIEVAKDTYVEANINPQESCSQLLVLTLKKNGKAKIERLQGSLETDMQSRLKPKRKVAAMIKE